MITTASAAASFTNTEWAQPITSVNQAAIQIAALTAQSQSTRELTIKAGLSCLASGATLYIRAGTYNEAILNLAIPSGSSWNAATTISAYPGDELAVIIKPSTNTLFVIFIDSNQPATQYVVFNGLVLDGTNINNAGARVDAPSGFIKFSNGEIKNTQGNGTWGGHGVIGFNNSWFTNMNVHHNGDTNDFAHGFYLPGHGNLIENSQIHDNGGWGVQVYQGNPNLVMDAYDNIIRNNFIYNNARSRIRGPGVFISHGANNQVYNNIIEGNVGGIALDYGADNALVYNNTIYKNNGPCIFVGADLPVRLSRITFATQTREALQMPEPTRYN